MMRFLEAPEHEELTLVKLSSNEDARVSKESLALEQGVVVGSGTYLSMSGAGEEEASALNNIGDDFGVREAYPLFWGIALHL
jgi:hypothetical protein